MHTHCHQKRDDVIKLILHLALCIQVYWTNKFPRSPGSLSSLKGNEDDDHFEVVLTALTPTLLGATWSQQVPGTAKPLWQQKKLFGPSLVHDNSSRGDSASPSGLDWEDGGCWVGLSGKIAKGLIWDAYCFLARMEKSWGRIVLSQPWAEIPWAQAVSQVKGYLSFVLLSPMTPLSTTGYWKAPAPWVGKSLHTGQCRVWSKQSQR